MGLSCFIMLLDRDHCVSHMLSICMGVFENWNTQRLKFQQEHGDSSADGPGFSQHFKISHIICLYIYIFIIIIIIVIIIINYYYIIILYICTYRYVCYCLLNSFMTSATWILPWHIGDLVGRWALHRWHLHSSTWAEKSGENPWLFPMKKRGCMHFFPEQIRWIGNINH